MASSEEFDGVETSDDVEASDNIEVTAINVLELSSPIIQAKSVENNEITVRKSAIDIWIEELINEKCPQFVIDTAIKSKTVKAEYDALDQKLRSILRDLSAIERTPLYETSEYSQVMNSIDSSSYVISFKNAGLFKVYTPEMLSTLNMQANSQFKGMNEIYEVVNRDSRQKIIIIIDGSVENEVEKIKNYVMVFFEKQKDTLHNDDIISYKNPTTGNFEMMINRFVNNFNEKADVVTKLTKFIADEEEKIGKLTGIYRKIDYRTNSNIFNTDLFLIPSKRGLNINPQDWLAHHVQTDNSRVSGVVNIYNINNINNTGDGNVTVGNHNDNSITKKNANKSVKRNDIQDFVNHIKSSNPSWYTGGNYISISSLHKQFVKITKSNMTCSIFSRKCKGILFEKTVSRTIDGKSIRQVMLYDIDDL